MLVRYMSDIHLEFASFSIPPMATDSETVLILAGDIGYFLHFEETDVTKLHLKSWCEKFKHVILVCGNHDYYNGSIETINRMIREWIESESITNLHFLSRNSVIIEDVSFIGTTLWTDYDNNNQHAKDIARVSMADYKYIWSGDTSFRITPDDLLKIHQHDKMFIFDEHKKAYSQGLKTVVITHHLPSYKSVHPFYTSSPLNCAFASNLDNEIEHSDIDVWVHGHTHYCFDYILGNTKIKCNPRGYVFSNRVENMEFNPYAYFNI